MPKKELRFTEIKCSTAREFFDRLSPLNPLNPPTIKPHQFIYRGQANADWGLVPTILRDSKERPNPIKRLVGQYNENLQKKAQIQFELEILRKFVEECDVQGLSVSGESEALRVLITRMDTDDYVFSEKPWPDPELLKTMALAQHHGIPTRLLDWTKRAYVAAYFAASSAIQKSFHKDAQNNISVWALNAQFKHAFSLIDVITLPGATSANMAVQAGCFTCVSLGLSSLHLNFKPLDLDFNQAMDSIEGNHLVHLWKITVPASESEKILNYCSDFGVTASVLFPGYDGVARAVNESISRWRLPDQSVE